MAEGMDTLLPTSAAARLARVSDATIRSWVARGHLTPAARTATGRPLYRARDVLEAERETRRRDDGARARARTLRRR